MTRRRRSSGCLRGPRPRPLGRRPGDLLGPDQVNREDFDITWNMALEAGGVLVSKDITINLEEIEDQVPGRRSSPPATMWPHTLPAYAF